MRDIHTLFADYAAYHQTKGNKWFHRVGIPLIMLTLLGMLARVGVSAGGLRVDLAMLLIVVAEVVYLMLDWRLGAVMLAVSVGFYFLGAWMPLWLDAGLAMYYNFDSYLRFKLFYYSNSSPYTFTYDTANNITQSGQAGQEGPPCRIVVIKTSGDRLREAPLSEVGGKRLFVKEIEDAMLRKDIDLAVHSSKDMPAVLPDRLAIGGVLPREEPLDAVVLPVPPAAPASSAMPSGLTPRAMPSSTWAA